MRAVVFANGVVTDYTALERWLRADDYLIGANGGTRHCLALGRIPNVVVGDLDSLSPTTVERLADLGVDFERHSPHKNETDLELAIERAVRDKASEILLLGAIGGRLDQTLANLLLLAQRDWPAPVVLAEGSQMARVIRGGQTLTLNGVPGSTVSLIPLSPQVTGITYRGLEYPLHDATLALGSTRGISNVLVEPPATISITAGAALVTQDVGET